jgi:hypothetical protein
LEIGVKVGKGSAFGGAVWPVAGVARTGIEAGMTGVWLTEGIEGIGPTGGGVLMTLVNLKAGGFVATGLPAGVAGTTGAMMTGVGAAVAGVVLLGVAISVGGFAGTDGVVSAGGVVGAGGEATTGGTAVS